MKANIVDILSEIRNYYFIDRYRVHIYIKLQKFRTIFGGFISVEYAIATNLTVKYNKQIRYRKQS
jgi:hypothetical protein